MGELRRVGLVDRGHELLRDVGEAIGAAEVVEDDARGRLGRDADDVVGRRLVEALELGVVMVEREVHARHPREVGGDVAVVELDLAVLHVLGCTKRMSSSMPSCFSSAAHTSPSKSELPSC